jgi:hypothetical protein
MHDVDMHDRERIARLRKLAAQLERLPATRARDELLREAHHRLVMLDTGGPPSSLWRDRRENYPTALFEHMALPALPRFR